MQAQISQDYRERARNAGNGRVERGVDVLGSFSPVSLVPLPSDRRHPKRIDQGLSDIPDASVELKRN